MKLSRTTLILLAVLAVVVVIAGIVITRSLADTPSDEDILMETAVGPSDDELVFINLASQIESIQFDASLFSDPRFQALVDIRVTVVPETVGRKDPFANLTGIAPAR